MQFEVVHELSWGGGKHGIFDYKPSRVSSFDEMKAFIFDGELLKNAPFRVESSEEMILPRGSALFLRSLDGIPMKGICRCPICNNFFVNATYREKIYCSSKCQNTAANKRLRERKKKGKK